MRRNRKPVVIQQQQTEQPRRRVTKAAINAARQKPIEVKKFGPPELMPGVVPKDKKPAIAMDDAASALAYSYANLSYGQAFQPFPGYPYLANLMTRAEFQMIANALSTELTREWIEFSATSTDDDEDTSQRIKELETAIEKYKLRHIMKATAVHECAYGRGQIAINIRGQDIETPLILSEKTIKQGSLEGFASIEALWTTPATYNALDPMAPDFYKPSMWFMLGKEIHASRLLTVITRQLPDMLKPAYNFSGLSLSQMAEPYIDNFLRTRQSVSDLIANFSITALKTSMDQVLQGNDDGQSVLDRAALFTTTRSNQGLMVLDNDREELVQVNTPLGGLHELQSQSQELICSVSHIPAMILTGISPSGLNASSDGEIRSFYDWISALQEAHWRPALDTCIKVIMLSLWGEIDESITFQFKPLWQMSAQEESQIRVNDANADAVYLDRNVVDVEEVRAKLAADKDSGWNNLDLDSVPMTYEDDDLDAQDKSVSEAQHRAMEAEAHGKSTIGIPEKVGKEFAEKDAE